jgi:hypothetical protein
MANKRNKVRNLKRRYTGNRYTRKEKEVIDKSRKSETTSASKLKKKQFSAATNCDSEIDNFFFLCNFRIIKNIFEKYSTCSECNSKLTVLHNKSVRMGFSIGIIVQCSNCDFENTFYSSPSINQSSKPGLNPYEINLRAVMAFREIGRGREAMSTFTAIMNMPPPLTNHSYDITNNKLHKVYKEISSQSMKAAVSELREMLNANGSDDEVIDCGISIDGTWQRRGYSSLNGVVAGLSHENKKVIDVFTLSKFCMQCEVHKRINNPIDFECWKATHNCQVNHFGSAGSMEAAGAQEIFHSSIQKYNLRYTKYLGDGDSSSFCNVVKSKPYGDCVIEKLECIGHYQKRLGSRLRQKIKDYRGRLLSDGLKISGKGRLTNKSINTMQNFVGMAIRQNTNNLLYMRNSVIAVLYHCTNFPYEVTRHQFCLKGKNSWCKWQSDKVTGKTSYRQKINLPVAIMDEIKPIFQELSNPEMLRKCLHGMTQNCNESFNGFIWQRCPKASFTARKILEIAVYSSILNYNDGFNSLSYIFKMLGFPGGIYFEKGAFKKDKKRLSSMSRKSTDSNKKRRKYVRSIKKGYLDIEKENDDVNFYASGSF